MTTTTSTDTTTSVALTVNGQPVRAHVDARCTLSDFLRKQCGTTGVHLGCEHGVCGACTVVLDGRTARSCCTLAVQAEGSRDHHRGRARRRTPSCTRCRRRSGSTTACSAASAPRGSC